MAASTLQRIPPNFVCPVDIVVCICKRRRLGCLPHPDPLSPVHIRLNWMTNNQLFTFQYTILLIHTTQASDGASSWFDSYSFYYFSLVFFY